MSVPFAHAWRTAGLLAVVLLACVSGCDGGNAVIPSSDEPLFYLVLNHRTPVSRADGQRALLLTAGSAVTSSYRTATRFEMSRRSDGRAFAWHSTGKTGTAPGDYAGTALHDANYVLPDSAGAGRLGALDLRPGETYDLDIETEGVRMRGSVTVPDAFAVRFGGPDGRTVFWPRVRGAAGYSVEARGASTPALQADTAFIVPGDSRLGDSIEVRVQALDPQLYRFQVNETVGRSGIDRGYGVFGALTEARGVYRRKRE